MRFTIEKWRSTSLVSIQTLGIEAVTRLTSLILRIGRIYHLSSIHVCAFLFGYSSADCSFLQHIDYVRNGPIKIVRLIVLIG